MAQKQIFHLPSVALELEFAGDEGKYYDLRAFRSALKDRLMKCLVADGVAFQERKLPVADDLKDGEDAVLRAEAVVDAWVLSNKYECSKSRDRHSRKACWVLDCDEQVTILMRPEE